jgi:CrcB protein
MPLQIYLTLAAGGALGTVARYFVSGVVANAFGQTFPFGTLIVNVSGSFVIGFFGTLTGPDGRILVDGTTRQFVMIGICGGYTTFSSFSLQTLSLMNDGEWLYVFGNIAGSVFLCLLFVWLGSVAASALNQLKGV